MYADIIGKNPIKSRENQELYLAEGKQKEIIDLIH